MVSSIEPYFPGLAAGQGHLGNPRFSHSFHPRHKPPTPVWGTSRFPKHSSTGTCSKLPFPDPFSFQAPAKFAELILLRLLNDIRTTAMSGNTVFSLQLLTASIYIDRETLDYTFPLNIKNKLTSPNTNANTTAPEARFLLRPIDSSCSG